MEVPKKADVQVVVVVIRRVVVVDVQTVSVKVTDASTVTVRSKSICQLLSAITGSVNFTAQWLICSSSCILSGAVFRHLQLKAGKKFHLIL